MDDPLRISVKQPVLVDPPHKLHVLLRHRLLPQPGGFEGRRKPPYNRTLTTRPFRKSAICAKRPDATGAPLPAPVPCARMMARTRFCPTQRHSSISSAIPLIASAHVSQNCLTPSCPW